MAGLDFDFKDVIYNYQYCYEASEHRFVIALDINDQTVLKHDYNNALNSRMESLDLIYEDIGKTQLYITRRHNRFSMKKPFEVNLVENQRKITNIRNMLNQATALKNEIIQSQPGNRNVLMANFQSAVIQLDENLTSFQNSLIVEDISLGDDIFDVVNCDKESYDELMRHMACIYKRKDDLNERNSRVSEVTSTTFIPRLFLEDLMRRYSSLLSRYDLFNLKKMYVLLDERCLKLEKDVSTLKKNVSTLTANNSKLTAVAKKNADTNISVIDVIEGMMKGESNVQIRTENMSKLAALRASLTTTTTATSEQPSSSSSAVATSSSAPIASNSSSSSSLTQPVLRKRTLADVNSSSSSSSSQEVPPPPLFRGLDYEQQQQQQRNAQTVTL